MNPLEAQAEKRSLSQEDEQDPPPKRKKTVTWAGDVPTTDADIDGPQSSAEEPAVIVLEQEPDSMFADLDESILDQQVDVPLSATEALTREGLLQHRIENIDKLYQMYEAEMWSLYEELHLRHYQFAQQQQQQQQGVPNASIKKKGDSPPPAAASPPVGSAEQGAAQPRQPVDLRQLLRRSREQAAAAPSDQPQLGAVEPSNVAAPASAVQSPQAEGSHEGTGDVAGEGPLPIQQQLQPAPSQDGGVPPQQAPQPDAQQAGQQQQLGPAGTMQAQEGRVEGKAAPAVVPQPVAGGAGFGGMDGECQAPPLFEEVEELIVSLGADHMPVPPEKLVQQRKGFLQHLGLIGRLEHSMLGAICRELDAFGALAVLCGRQQRYLLKKTAVLLGRNTESQGKVDVDLSGEGHSQTVSRQQAQLFLEPDGCFHLRCLGRRNVFVNGQQVEQGQAAPMPHLSLIKVGGVSLLFVANHAAVQRVMRRSAALAV